MSKKSTKTKAPKATQAESKPKGKQAQARPDAGDGTPPGVATAAADVPAEAATDATHLQVKKDANGRFWVVPKDGGDEHGPYGTKKEATHAKVVLASGAPSVASTTEAKPARAKKVKEPKPKRVSALDAAAQVLAASKEPMNCTALVEAMASQGLWESPGGRTPHATLYSAIIREIATKGAEARFVKQDRGTFAAAGA